MTTEPNWNSAQIAEWEAQEGAVERLRQGVRIGEDGRVDAYQSLFQAIAAAPRSEPPADFAELALRAVREAQVDEYIERWLMRLAGLVALVGVAVFAGPALWSSLNVGMATTLGPAAGALSSPLLWAVVAAGATAAGCDAGYRLRHPEHRLAPA